MNRRKYSWYCATIGQEGLGMLWTAYCFNFLSRKGTMNTGCCAYVL